MPSLFIPISRWWNQRIIRTKLLLGIFLGILLYQTLITVVQIRNLQTSILRTYHEKAVTLSFALDCVLLKDPELLYNMLERIGDSELKEVLIDPRHPSCKDRENYLQRLKKQHGTEFQKAQTTTASPADLPQEAENLEVIEEASAESLPSVVTTPSKKDVVEEIIEEVADPHLAATPQPGLTEARSPASIESPTAEPPLKLTSNPDEVKGVLREYDLVLGNETVHQIEYKTQINGVTLTFNLNRLPKLLQNNLYQLILTAIGNLAVVFIIIWLLTGRLIRPLKQLTAVTQEITNSEAFAQGKLTPFVEIYSGDEVGQLSASFKKMLEALRQSYAKIHNRNAALADLLNNIGQGFLSFGNNYGIHSEYSKACELFFQQPLIHQNAVDLLFREKAPAVREIMDLLFQGTGDLAVMGDLLPKEIQGTSRTLHVDYRWIQAIDETSSHKIMIILTDVTLAKELESQLKADEERNAMILKVAADQDGFMQFLRELQTLFNQIQELLTQSVSPKTVPTLFRCYHTIKGGSASYALKKVAEQAHQIESGLEEVRQGREALTDSRRLALVQETQELQNILQESLQTVSSIVSIEDQRQSERVYRIAESKLQKVHEVLKSQILEAQHSQLELAFYALRQQPIQALFRKYASAAEGLAERLGKHIKVEMKGANTEVPYERLESLFGAMIHLVRNSVDHGIESPEIRSMLGKPETGQLLLSAEKTLEQLLIRIQDDGGGIDPERVKAVALKKQVITEAQAQALKEEELIQLIFAPGFSTKEEVSEVSGRGVGLDAVKSSLEELHGHIDVQTVLDEGTTFTLVIPWLT
ncbi:ATP-binding protein [Deltaproteobacteria bacterium TL4]